MNRKIALLGIGVFLVVTLFGWIFVEIMSETTWMVDKMDYIMWSIIYLAGILGVSTYLIIVCIVKNLLK